MRVKVLLAVFSSPGSGAAAICERPGAGAADIEHQRFGLQVAVRPQGDAAGSQDLGLAGADIAHGEVDLGAGVSALMQRDLGGETGIGQGAGSHDDIIELHVVFGVLASEAHGVNGNVAGAKGADGVRADAAGVIVAVAEQHYRADGQVGSLLAQLLEAVAEARRGGVGLQSFEIVDAGGHIVHAIQARLKGASRLRGRRSAAP